MGLCQREVDVPLASFPTLLLRWGPRKGEMGEQRVHRESAGQMQWEGSPPCSALPLGGGDGVPSGVVIVLCSLAERSDLFPFALESDLNDSVRMHSRKPAQSPINPLSHFSDLKMIRAWWMTARGSL